MNEVHSDKHPDERSFKYTVLSYAVNNKDKRRKLPMQLFLYVLYHIPKVSHVLQILSVKKVWYIYPMV